jgi:hypothetical protein
VGAGLAAVGFAAGELRPVIDRPCSVLLMGGAELTADPAHQAAPGFAAGPRAPAAVRLGCARVRRAKLGRTG